MNDNRIAVLLFAHWLLTLFFIAFCTTRIYRFIEDSFAKHFKAMLYMQNATLSADEIEVIYQKACKKFEYEPIV